MIKTVCKWCQDRLGGCLYCAAEIERQERATTERIQQWQPPSDELIEMIRAKKIHLSDDASTIADRVAVAVLLDQLNRMTAEEIEGFIVRLQTPPPTFQADERDELAMDVLRKHFHIQTLIGDVGANRPLIERAERARVELAVRRRHRVGPPW